MSVTDIRSYTVKQLTLDIFGWMMEDTEMMLAMLSSLLEPPLPDISDLLDALVKCDGDVESAACLLKSRKASCPSPQKKRKRATDLDDWLKQSSTKTHNGFDRQRSPRTSNYAIQADGFIPVSTKGQSSSSGSSNSTSSPSKPSVNLMTVLRQPPPPSIEVQRSPPLLLTNPTLVAQHTPCTLHTSVLPPELACQLFYTMLEESQSWKRNKWWLFERLVESPHRTSFYARRPADNSDDDPLADDQDGGWQETAQYWYNGRMTGPPSPFPDAMEEACRIIERVVNDELLKRSRFPLEWSGSQPGLKPGQWQANVAAANCYEGAKEGVGPHSDRLTYLGPYPTIASLSLGTNRVFRLREVVPSDQASKRHARTFNIPLPHNSLIIMHASTQEKFKHSAPPQSTIDLYRPSYPPSPGSAIEPSNCRINITFRFYRPDFHASTIPRCKCGVPTVLKPDMKNRHDGRTDKYWWHCNAGEQNEGKDCGYWKVMDIKAEGRGPCVQDISA